MNKANQAIIVAFIVLFGATGVGAWYAYTEITALNNNTDALTSRIESLEQNFSSTTALLQGTIQSTLSELEEQKDDVGSIASRLKSYQKEVNSYTDTVETLEKLSKTDPELLQKYSKVFFLNEHYSPPRLEVIPAEYGYSDLKQYKIHASVWPYLEEMLDDAKKAGVNLYIFSAFRSFNEQSALKGAYSVTYGAGTANQFSADQGYSEHQLGTTVDFMTGGLGGVLDANFEKTAAFTWLNNNAYKYGFVMSYPKGNPYYVYEPWHWRFVGTKLADDLHDDKKGFYDLEQRDIDEYLVSIFE